jgi:hypothetical protein
MTEKIKKYKSSFALASVVLLAAIIAVVFFMFTAPVINAF